VAGRTTWRGRSSALMNDLLRDSARPGSIARPGRPARADYEYVRNGTANIFCIVEPKTGKRLTHATRRRTNKDFGRALHRIAKAYPESKHIHLVADNKLSSHSEKACVDAFGKREGRSLWVRFKVHFTPKQVPHQGRTPRLRLRHQIHAVAALDGSYERTKFGFGYRLSSKLAETKGSRTLLTVARAKLRRF
jgi:hypothetical protein